MKKLAFILIFLAFTYGTYSQSTLFGNNEDVQIGGYGGPELKVINGLDQELGLLVGGRGAVVINKSFAIGGGGYGMTFNDKYEELRNNKNYEIDFGYGGFLLEYIHEPDEILHFNVNLLVGWGGVQIHERYSDVHYSVPDFERFGYETFFVLEPGIQLEANFFNWMKVAAGITYRHLMSFDKYYDYTSDDFKGVSGALTFKFGGGF